MEKKYCINCMEQFDGNLSRCPHCGYEQTAESFPFGVKPDTILRGRYLVGRMLGQGGFGITYVGYDLTLELKVAIKEYFPTGIVTRNNTVSNQVQWNTVQIDGEQWKRGCESFLKEARRMAKLDSLPGIVRVRDTFPENRTAYIVMDFVEGENLKQKLKKNGVMSLEQCIAMLRPLMESLGEMHRKGLVHRDISPDNIMIRPDGNACLLDFGAAKDITLHQSLSSQQVAKKGFSPLEQYRENGHIGPWTDVYALCATIYYCVTGKLIPDAMDRIYDETVNFDALPGNSFGGAADVLRDGLRIHTEERLQTVEELLARLDGAAGAGTNANSGFDEQAASGQEYGNGQEMQESRRRKENKFEAIKTAETKSKYLFFFLAVTTAAYGIVNVLVAFWLKDSVGIVMNNIIAERSSGDSYLYTIVIIVTVWLITGIVSRYLLCSYCRCKLVWNKKNHYSYYYNRCIMIYELSQLILSAGGFLYLYFADDWAAWTWKRWKYGADYATKYALALIALPIIFFLLRLLMPAVLQKRLEKGDRDFSPKKETTISFYAMISELLRSFFAMFLFVVFPSPVAIPWLLAVLFLLNSMVRSIGNISSAKKLMRKYREVSESDLSSTSVGGV